jgi:hypothetical protein
MDSKNNSTLECWIHLKGILVGDQTFKCLGQVGSKGRDPLFLVSKQNMNGALGTFDTLIIVEKTNYKWKSYSPKLKGVKNSKKQTIKHYKGWFPNTKKLLCMLLCYIKIQKWFVEFQMVLLEHFKSFKMNKKKEIMSFENRRGPKKNKKKKTKTPVISWKAYFCSCYYFITPFFLHFKDDF